MQVNADAPQPRRLNQLTLSSGRATVDVTGGDLLSVSSLRLGTQEFLAEPSSLPEAYRVHGRRAGITLLHPWANRLSSDTYHAGGHRAHLEPGDPHVWRDPNGLAIHGLSARSEWSLNRSRADRLIASLDVPAERAFPFPHRVEVCFSLSGSDDSAELRVTTQIIASDEAVPIAFGWHPYFLTDLRSCVDLPDRRALELDARGLPTGRGTHAGAESLLLKNAGLDDAIADLRDGSQMSLHVDGRVITVAWIGGYPYGQIFAPTDAPVASLEPMTAPTNALLGGGGATAAARPGSPYEACFEVRVSRHTP